MQKSGKEDHGIIQGEVKRDIHLERDPNEKGPESQSLQKRRRGNNLLLFLTRQNLSDTSEIIIQPI